KDNRKFAILAVCFGIVGSLVAIAGFVCGLVELAKLSKQPVTKPNAKNKKNTPKRRKVTNKKEVK
ncbi:MAG: hypothetical protein LBB45_06575, partial [Methanobrevibacter sp.]|nr:hypothetical protein [Candidatus Methanovirga basalitermitum]